MIKQIAPSNLAQERRKRETYATTTDLYHCSHGPSGGKWNASIFILVQGFSHHPHIAI